MDWVDTAKRAAWTFVEAFVGVLATAQMLALEGAMLLSAFASGVAAALVPLKDYALTRPGKTPEA